VVLRVVPLNLLVAMQFHTRVKVNGVGKDQTGPGFGIGFVEMFEIQVVGEGARKQRGRAADGGYREWRLRSIEWHKPQRAEFLMQINRGLLVEVGDHQPEGTV